MGAVQGLQMRLCANCGCDSTCHESPEDLQRRNAAEEQQKQAAAEKAQRLQDASQAEAKVGKEVGSSHDWLPRYETLRSKGFDWKLPPALPDVSIMVGFAPRDLLIRLPM